MDLINHIFGIQDSGFNRIFGICDSGFKRIKSHFWDSAVGI